MEPLLALLPPPQPCFPQTDSDMESLGKNHILKGEIYTGKEAAAEDAGSLVPSPRRIYFKIKVPILCGLLIATGGNL